MLFVLCYLFWLLICEFRNVFDFEQGGSMKIKALLFIIFTVFLCGVLPASAGKIVLATDEWTLSDKVSAANNDGLVFATNVASWFTGDSGNFLVYSDNFGLTGNNLETAVTSAGYGWTVDPSLALSLDILKGFDGLFLCGTSVPDSLLIEYVRSGGNVYLAGGAAKKYGKSSELWNGFLNAFGLGIYSDCTRPNGIFEIDSDHDIFEGVDALYQRGGNTIYITDAGSPYVSMLVDSRYAVYDDTQAPIPNPEPATLVLLGAGLLGAAGVRRKTKNR